LGQVEIEQQAKLLSTGKMQKKIGTSYGANRVGQPSGDVRKGRIEK